METIYIDVLIVLNVYVNCFLLRITAKITGSPLRPLRCAAAAFYGSLFSLLILAPKLPAILNIVIKLIAAVTVVIAAFGFHGRNRLIKNSAAFFCTNFILAGGIYAAYSWLKPAFMHFSNSYFYIDFSLVILVISTAVLYLIVCILRRFSDKATDDGYFLMIRIREKIYKLDGLADTGNSLTDFFTGKPVVICEKKELNDIPANDVKMRILPLTTVSGSGFMQIFRPDELLIINKTNGERKSVDAMIGLGETGSKAIFNPKLLR